MMLFSVVAGGALATAFIPVFTGFATADDRTVAEGIAGIAAYLLAARLLGLHEIDRFVSAVRGRSRAV
jgi:hypothetical protein